MNFDVLLKGGDVFTDGGIVTADVGVRDGLIVAIGRYLASDRLCPVYDVRGKWVVPAFVELCALGDAQLELSKRAAIAGVSLLVSVVTPKPWESPDQTCKRVAAERPSAWIDRAYAVRVLAGQLPTYEALKEAQRQGLAYLVVSLSPRTDGLGLEDDELYTLLERAKNARVSVAVWLEHAGFARTVKRPIYRALKGSDSTLLHTYSLPGEFVQAARAIALAHACDTEIGLCGVTSADTLALAQGMPVLAFAHSLLLSSAVYGRRRGRWYRMHPPLRSKDALKTLQKRFFAERTAMVAFGAGMPPSPALKAWRFPEGSQPTPLPALPAGVQALLGRLVPKKPGGASGKHVQKLVRLLSKRPFVFAGHAKERGTISIGAVADLVVLGPAERARLGPLRPKSSDEFNPFMGQSGLSLPALVLNRGHVVAEAGALVGDAPRGMLAVPFSQR